MANYVYYDQNDDEMDVVANNHLKELETQRDIEALIIEKKIKQMEQQLDSEREKQIELENQHPLELDQRSQNSVKKQGNINYNDLTLSADADTSLIANNKNK